MKKRQIRQLLRRARRRWWKFNHAHKLLDIVLLALLIFTIFSYTTGQYYIHKHRNEPLNFGVTFVPRYARYYGLDPKEVMDGAIKDLVIRNFRLVSYWSDIEKKQGEYDFSELDWQFQKAEESNSKVSLAIGLRQPRWPECHMPTWAQNTPKEDWQPALNNFMETVIKRYKSSPALDSYQLENEYFLNVFGECTDFSRDRLVTEYNSVKKLDPDHKLIVSRSNNWGGYPMNKPIPDEFAMSVYKRVWDKSMTKRYIEYPYPPWFYSSLAGVQELIHGKTMRIHELQAEAWLPENKGFTMNNVNDIPEQNKSMNAEILQKRIKYGVDTGMRDIDLWGFEWWYWQKQNGHPELWDTAKDQIQYYSNN
ncbi:hypothetical protein A3F37_02575 [Candidatus Saccharibacteria bacterium RIFCSPHIGHO2_12_FULL_41_12]|nr:MAG: hypothetical protein A3F37_02575 [Candidatus Saccharibacteria bacterium RIFCSPHIGHO2_12_FULL_41_12]